MENLRKHQSELKGVLELIRLGDKTIKNVLVSVTPGGGKSALPAVIASVLAEPLGMKICWVVPRDALREQGESDFIAPWLRDILGHTTEIRSSTNDVNPTRGTVGYVTTYQAIAAAPDLHEKEFDRHKYILFLDECHHVPDSGGAGDEAAYYTAIAPLVGKANLRVFASGTLERHDGQRIAWLPYKRSAIGSYVDAFSVDGWKGINYTRKDALADGAIVPLHVVYGDGSAQWIDQSGKEVLVDSISGVDKKNQSAALQTILETRYAYELIDKTCRSWQNYRTVYRRAKLLVVAPSISVAKEYLRHLKNNGIDARIATTDNVPEAKANITAFRNHIDVLVTVGMAYEGLNVKEISHVTLLTRYRSRPWVEQAISRANRTDEGKTHGYIFAPDDPLMAEILMRVEKEQQGIVFDPMFGAYAGSKAQTDRFVISPLASGLMRSRARGQDDGTEVGYGEMEVIEDAINQVGAAIGPVEFKQIMVLAGYNAISNGQPGQKLHPAPVSRSERERNLRKTIDNHIKVASKGNADTIRMIRRTAKMMFRKPVDELELDELIRQWNWLQSVYPIEIEYGTPGKS